tara:strand:+ start:812 stop:1237 length:426 start_codon:yes stop_codon:yes gene_type:complete
MSFQSDIINFSNKKVAKVDRIRRAIILKLFTAVILDTPVDTGLLRGNWQTSVGKPKDGVNSTPDKYGRRLAVISNNLGKFGDDVHMTNNLPYAKVAEYGEWNGPTDKVNSSGFSRKAPSGMMRKNANRFRKILKRVARETK